MHRIEHGVLAAAILVAFIADIRLIAPLALGVLVWWAIRRHIARFESAIGIALLAGSTLAFALDNEVAAWALALAAAVLSGIEAGRPRDRDRSVSAR